ncbi:MAG TPA: DUF5131 family protein [Terriglobales bacterium]|nr:DUF5131 family protein [Terriglobales bacterium]
MSSIEWTDETWNPIAGCSLMSPGCTNCYAMRMAARLEAMGVEKYRGLTRRSGGRSVWTGKIKFDKAALEIPLRWKSPRKVFVNSMSDLFHPAVGENNIRKIWGVMARTPQHTYQILSKRPDRMEEIVRGLPLLTNVWLGTSVENSDYLHRIDNLRQTPAVVRFVSFEPLLGSVKSANLTDIAWAIVGGESGPRSRPMEARWVNEIKHACRKYDVAFFFKQWGGANKKRAGRILDGRTWDEYPSSVRPAHVS